MANSDQVVITIDILMLLIYSGVWATGLFTHKLTWSFALLNAVAATGLIVYWITNQLRLRQHFIEGREIAVLIFEFLAACLGIYTVWFQPTAITYKIAQYIIFGIHFLVLVAMLIFMLTFSMKKLW